MTKLYVNGKQYTIDAPDDTPLLWAIRDRIGLTGTKFGCGMALCGACTVHIDGKAVRSCQIPMSSIAPQQKVVTLEGLGSPQRPHPVQKAFIDTQAAQCGYCINGMIMESVALLATNRKPSDADIKKALANNLCRCGTHVRILAAVKRAAGIA